MKFLAGVLTGVLGTLVLVVGTGVLCERENKRTVRFSCDDGTEKPVNDEESNSEVEQ